MSQWQMPPQYGANGPRPMSGYQPAPPVALKQNGAGIASFIIAVLMGVGIFAIVIVAGIMETSRPGGLDEESPEAMMIGLGVLCGMFFTVAGAVLGLIGLFLANQKRLFAILGLVFNCLIILGVIGLMILGSLEP